MTVVCISFSPFKHTGARFDLAVKYVVNQGSSIIQTLYSLSHQCSMPNFKIIGLKSGEENLKVFTIYGHGGHLGHVTKTNLVNLCPLFPMKIHIYEAINNFVEFFYQTSNAKQVP